MIKPEPNCRYCKSRTADCHSICDSFAEYKVKLAEYNKTIRQRKRDLAEFRSVKIDTITTTMKRVHKR